MGKQHCFEQYMPVLAMVGLQFIIACTALTLKVAFAGGLSPMVFVVYRQAIATVALAPVTIIAARRRGGQIALGIKGFILVFLAAFIGVTLNQFLFSLGLRMAPASMGTAIFNLCPAITFIIAASLGMERVEIRNIRSMAKVFGTIICVAGAVSIALFKGPMLMINQNSGTIISMFLASGDEWKLGCLCFLLSTSCWALWIILQVPICRDHLDPLSLSTWMCFLSCLQSAVLTFILEPDWGVWRLKSMFEFFCCLYGGIIASSVSFYVQSWCIAKRGPVFSAMFNPLTTVIVTFFAVLLLNEHLYIGSVIGAVAVVVGLYVVLWGKAKDYANNSTKIPTSIDEEESKISETNIKEPLLSSQSQVDIETV